MTEPDDFGLSPIQTLSRVGDPTRSTRHVAFWKAWSAAVLAESPRLSLRGMTGEDPSDLSATHEFISIRHTRVGCTLLEPSRGKARAGVVVTHGYQNVPTLAQSGADWKPLTERGVAVLIIRVRGYPGSQVDAPRLVDHAMAGEGGGGLWITHGLEVPISDRGLGCEWSFAYAAADTVNACRALRAHLGGAPISLHGESLGAALAIVAASYLGERDEIGRMVIGLPSMGDWPWRLSLPAERAAGGEGGVGGLIRRFMADYPELESEIGATLRVMDALVHARRVSCPVLCKLALRDDIVPAPTAAAVFNTLGTPPGLKCRFITRFGHYDGGIGDARRHALFERLVPDFLDPGIDPLSREWACSDLSRGAAPRRPAEPAAEAGQVPTLFGDMPLTSEDHDERLIAAYAAAGRTLDDLPYTEDFDRLYATATADGQSPRAVFHRLHNLRKAGKLPRLGRPATKPPRIDPTDEAALSGLVVAAVGSLGQRDQLPYSPEFDRLVEVFNQRTGRNLTPHDIWRLVAKLAK